MKTCLSKINIKTINSKKGFTLIEIIVVIGIMLVITALTIFNSPKLNSGLALSNTAYELSLMIRDAQVSGLGSKLLEVDDGISTLNQGVYFDKTTPEKIILFADINKDNKYTVGEETEVYNINNVKAGNLLKICRIMSGDNCQSIQNLNIIFKRPNPEAYFHFTSSDGIDREHVGNVAINLGFPGDLCRSIVIYKTGAIQIDKSFCN
jgi:prepilin-type N-terminal cleavage/methylation domain-containing protein